jgi:hypothetical protein
MDPVMIDSRMAKFQLIVDKCKSQFHGWVLLHANSVGCSGRNQMFYVTFVAHYHGLSRDGIDLCAKFGYGVNLNKFDTDRKMHTELIRVKVAAMETRPNVKWFDNFSKFLRHSAPTISKDVFASCLWTGVTINQYTGPEVDVSVRYDVDNKVIRAMPENLLSTRDAVSVGVKSIYDEGMQYFHTSLAHRYNVTNVPLKIDVKRFPEMKNTIDSNKNSTKQINPYKLIKLNIGSNRGLLAILRQFQDDHKMNLADTCTEYHTLNLDENIFYRTLKVSYLLYMQICASRQLNIRI